MKLLVQSPRKFSTAIWSLILNITKFVRFNHFSKFRFFFPKTSKNHGFCEINEFISNKRNNRLSDYLLDNFFYQFVNNFSELLLCKNVLDIFNMIDF